MFNARRRWKIKGITSVEATMARNKREILAIYIRIVASGKKKMRREDGMINCPDPNIARAVLATYLETS
jgi:hypothetical protein